MKKVNARVQWSTSKHNNKEWENKSAECVLAQRHVGLMLDLVAAKAIPKDRKIFIAYGEACDEAWAEHTLNWKPPQKSEEFMKILKRACRSIH